MRLDASLAVQEHLCFAALPPLKCLDTTAASVASSTAAVLLEDTLVGVKGEAGACSNETVSVLHMLHAICKRSMISHFGLPGKQYLPSVLCTDVDATPAALHYALLLLPLPYHC